MRSDGKATSREKLFIGPQARTLRLSQRLKLEDCARRLGISASYLSQIESNQRPATARVLTGLVEVFQVSPQSLQANEAQRLVADLKQAISESDTPASQIALSDIRRVATEAPAFARRFLEVHLARQRLQERLGLTDEAIGFDENTLASSQLPYEEVREYFHLKDNYIDALDREAEALADKLSVGRPSPARADLEHWLADEGVRLLRASSDVWRSFEPEEARLTISDRLPETTQTFQIAYHIAEQAFAELIEEELALAGFRSPAAADLCRIGLCNYAAGALLMPYQAFADAAQASRHDLDALALSFGVSLEQVCHRLSNLQRPGRAGTPVYFLRVDAAGNITKRHSANRLRFPRFGGSCPVWNIHDACAAPDRWLIDLVETPDQARYLSIARGVLKPSGRFNEPGRRYALGLGCEIAHAHRFVYADGLNLQAAPMRIGPSCRVCERDDCAQRAFPPVDRQLLINRNERRVTPFGLA